MPARMAGWRVIRVYSSGGRKAIFIGPEKDARQRFAGRFRKPCLFGKRGGPRGVLELHDEAGRVIEERAA